MTSKVQKSVADAVQTFREAQNLLPNLYTHLSALENIMTQKATLTGAVRRREQCFADSSDASSTAFFLHEDNEEWAAATGNEKNFLPSSTSKMAPGNSRRCLHVTTAVAAAPLGVLSAFSSSSSSSTAHHLIAQHQRDEDEILGVVSRITQQSWSQKAEQLKAKVAGVESQLSTAAGDQPMALSAGSKLTPAQLSMALYGLVSCVLKMGSVLQEVMLALRKDTRHALMSDSQSSAGATVLANYLVAVLNRENQHVDSAALYAMHDALSARELDEKKSRRQDGGGAAFFGAPADPLTLVEAVGMLESFVKSRWLHCRDVYLTEEAHILLEHV